MSQPDDPLATRLENASRAGGWTKFSTYFRLSGPGWLQSAITLGAGTLSGSLFLGVVGGYTMLWVQAFALLMGVVMLAAIGYVSLSIKESPFQGLRRLNPALAWGWIIATLAANMVWSFPQFSLAYGAIMENFAGNAFGGAEKLSWKLGISFAMLAVVARVTLFYDSKGVGIRVYETVLKIVVAIIAFSFVGVAAKLAFTGPGLPFGEIFKGFVPSLAPLQRPSEALQAALDAIQNPEARAYWTSLALEKQRDVIIAAASAAVGINMTFLLPFSMRAKGWGKAHRGLAIFDLSIGMVIPFLIVTSSIVIVSGYLFHAKPHEQLTFDAAGELALAADAVASPQARELQSLIDGRSQGALADTPVESAERRVAATMLNRSNGEFATSLEELVGPATARFIFGIGVLGMALSSISVLMLISGFVVCEMFGYPHGGIQHKLGTLLASTGALWPILWTGQSRVYLAIPTSIFGYTLLPVAFFAFFLMMNSKSLLGAERPVGGRRFAWNTLMGLALLVTGTASVITAWDRDIAIGGQLYPLGKIFLIGFGTAIVASHFWLRRKRASQAAS